MQRSTQLRRGLWQKYVQGSDRGEKVPIYHEGDYSIASYRNGTWEELTRHWWIGAFSFSDGRAFGNGYMEVSWTEGGPDSACQYVDAGQSVRQVFTPPNTIQIDAINLAAVHTAGTNSLAVRLVDGADQELWSGELAGFPTGNPTVSESGFRGVVINPLNLTGWQIRDTTVRDQWDLSFDFHLVD